MVTPRLVPIVYLAVTTSLASPAAVQARVSDGIHPWRPAVESAESYIARRRGLAAFSVMTPRHDWGFRGRVAFHSASVVKAMLLVAFLRQHAAHRRLTGDERATLEPMIQRSDNNAANRMMGIIGTRGLSSLAHRAGMVGFVPQAPIWGYSHIDARDQARFFMGIDRLLPRRHRAYGMHLLRTVIPSQRWGIGRVRPGGWKLYFKGGWGSGSGLVDHQVALLRRRGARVAVAVLTRDNPSHEYGKETLRGVFKRLMRRLDTTVTVR